MKKNKKLFWIFITKQGGRSETLITGADYGGMEEDYKIFRKIVEVIALGRDKKRLKIRKIIKLSLIL